MSRDREYDWKYNIFLEYNLHNLSILSIFYVDELIILINLYWNISTILLENYPESTIQLCICDL